MAPSFKKAFPMYSQRYPSTVLALLLMPTFVLASEAAVASDKPAKRLVCRPQCQWQETSPSPSTELAPVALMVRQALATPSAAEDAPAPAAQPTTSTPVPVEPTPVAEPAAIIEDTQPAPRSAEVPVAVAPPRPAEPALDLSVDGLVTNWAAGRQPVAAGEGGLDLWQAVGLAVETYPSIRDAAALVNQRREAVTVARAGYLPTLQTGINTGKQGRYGNGQSLSLNATQTIYDFGKVDSAVQGAEAGVQVQQLQMAMTIDEVARQSARALIEVARYSALLEAANGQLEGVQRLHDLARQRAGEGASTQADLIQAQARVEAARSAVLNIETQLQQQRHKLRTMIGRDVPEAGVQVPERPLLVATRGIEPATATPLGVQLAEAEREEAQAQLALARANTLPSFTVDGGVSKLLGSAGDSAGDQVYTLTLGVKHDLFAGGAPSARVRGAGQAVRAAEQRIETRKLEARDEWTMLQQEMRGLEARLEVLAEREQSIRDTQQLYRDQYLSLGTRSLLDLLNAEQEIFQAQSDRVNARHDLWGAQVAFIQATGHMHDVFQLKGAPQ